VGIYIILFYGKYTANDGQLQGVKVPRKILKAIIFFVKKQ